MRTEELSFQTYEQKVLVHIAAQQALQIIYLHLSVRKETRKMDGN